MNGLEILPLIVKMATSFISVFIAIAVWAKVRNIIWVFMFLSAIFFFADTLMASMVTFGLFEYTLPFFDNLPVMEMVLGSLPFVFMSLGFLVLAYRNRGY